MYAFIASAALLATTAVAQSVGKAIVVNKCEYDIYLANTPAQGNGYNDISQTMAYGDTYNQTWTELNVGGWSIKLSKDSSDWSDNILQYEYTFDNDGIIWYDLSAVNGNPWDKNWEVTATSEGDACQPKQQAYRYATDDAYGMQACPQDAEITVTLCSGEEQNDGAAASISSSAAAVTSSLAAATSAASILTPPSPPPATTASAVTQTTMATSVSSSSIITTDPAGSTVTQVATAVVTEVATVTHWWHHPHDRRHFHA